MDLDIVKPREMRSYTEKVLKANLVPLIYGAPGTGKSSIIKDIAKQFNLALIDVRLTSCEPTDFMGLPMMDSKSNKAVFKPMSIFPLDTDPVPEGKDGFLLFLDEFTSIDKDIEKSAYRLVLDREVGQQKLHPKCRIVMAGNRIEDNAIARELGTAMKNRIIHLTMHPHLETWLEDVAYPHNYDDRILAYLNYHPEFLMDFDPDSDENTFCSPRSWEFVNRLIKGQEISFEDGPLLRGTIRAGVATDFISFCKVYKNLVTIEQIVNDPHNTPVPTELPARWALTCHLTTRVTQETLDPVVEYIDRFSSEFKIVFMRYINKNFERLKIRATPRYQKLTTDLAQYLYL